MTKDIEIMVREALASAYGEGSDTQYQVGFAGEGERKSQYIIDHLQRQAAIGPLRLEQLGYLSIGGADGSEIEAVFASTAISRAVLLEHSQEAAAVARSKAVVLKRAGKELVVLQGDATATIDDCLVVLDGWRCEGLISGLVCSAQGVLHELSRRSKGFDLHVFIGKLFRNPEWQTCAFYSREPCVPEGWPREVQIKLPALNNDLLVRFARYVRDRLSMEGDPQAIANGWVVMPSVLAIETLHKLVRNHSLARTGHELGEQLTEFDPLEVKKRLENSVAGMRVTVERVATIGFKNALEQHKVEYSSVDLKPLSLPRTHSEIIGFACTYPQQAPPVQAGVPEIQRAATPVDLAGTDVDRIFQGEVSPNGVLRWMSQFSPGDRPVINEILRSFNYYGQARLEELCKALHVEILDRTIGFKVMYVGFGGAAKSGPGVAYNFRRANGLPGDAFLEEGALPFHGENTILVFLDDIVATGHQAAKHWEELRFLGKITPGTRVLLATLVATDAGLRYVQEHSELEPCCADRIRSEGNPLLTGAGKDRFAEVGSLYGRRIEPRAPLGYEGSCLLVGFRHATPDNTLPIFWRRTALWEPLLLQSGSSRIATDD
ncbi:MAG: desVI [Myxococcaceae bacterium]|nr:desVI [Myxococcaceae bacterium]